jgi:arylsulfatase A-like enzyme
LLYFESSLFDFAMKQLTACLALWTLTATVAGASQPLPNILMIVIDDLGWSDVGWHGGFGKTPVMDELVRTGVELDQHYVQPVCTPTRTALLSGRYPGRFGPHALAPSNLRAMPADAVTLALALRQRGYQTFQSGKWHLGSRPEWGPNAFGFDHSYGTLTGAADPWTHKYRRGPYEETWHRDGVFVRELGNATELVAAEAVKRIQEAREPWFGYVAFHAVHTPVDAPDEFKRLYDGVSFHDDPQKHDSRLRMAAMVAQVDAKIGEIVAAVEQRGERDRTLIVVSSDNGGIESLANVYVGDVADSPYNSENDPLRGEKNTLYEGGIRVCALANWPGTLAPSKMTQPMHVVDWFPTIARLAGYDADRDLEWDGVDQWPALRGAADQPISPGAETRSIYIALPRARMVRQGDWKLIERDGGERRPELYHLAVDPFEKRNLASSEPERVAALRRLMADEQAKDDPVLPADLLGLPN